MNLKQALKTNQIDKFIQEHQVESGDQKKFDSTLSSMVGKSKAIPKPSSQDKA